MKTVLLVILTLFSFGLIAQTKSKFLFYDPCSKQTLELDYRLWYYDSTKQITAGQSVILDQRYYLLSTQFKPDSNDWIATFSFDIHARNISSIDTIYLNKLRSMWNGLLHLQKTKFFYCNMVADGKIQETDTTGTVRATGRFQNGIPQSNIKFFDKYGQLEQKWIYSNGNLKRIKKTEPNRGNGESPP